MHTIRLAGTLTAPPSVRGDELRRLPADVDLLEIRADAIGDIDPDWLRSRFRGRLLFTLRGQGASGVSEPSPDERLRRLRRAARHYDLVDLDADRDLTPAVLACIAPHQRVISWTGAPTTTTALADRVRRMTSLPAVWYRAIPQAHVASDGLAPLRMLHDARRDDVVSYASGDAGFWSRLLAPRLGAPLLFGAVGDGVRSLSEPPLARLIEDYDAPRSLAPDCLYGIVGSPVTHSLSPLLHNRAYRRLGVRALYLPFHEPRFDDFWRDMVDADPLGALGTPIRGLTVVSPHKERVLGVHARTVRVNGADEAVVERAGSANLIVRNGHGWRSATTDPEGVVDALRDRRLPIAQKVAVIGCGGAGRAVAAALDHLGAEVTLVNRSIARGLLARDSLGLPFTPLAEFSADGYATIVNATPVGRNGDALPFDVGVMRAGGAVVDLAYGREPTPLIREARARGLTAVDGLEVCLIQVRHQFRLMTGLEMPGGTHGAHDTTHAAPLVRRAGTA